LCIGLDPQLEKLPVKLPKNLDGILEFNKIIIELTKTFVCAYKLNLAFYEQYGSKGIEVLEKTLDRIPKEIVKIGDGKRADIGNTSKAYARSLYEHFQFDAETLNPFLGIDSLEPFFEYESKLNFVLICTSNSGASDFQKIKAGDFFLYEIILEKFIYSFDCNRLGFVVGATNEDEFRSIRNLVKDNFILVPGIGVQGGNLEYILQLNNDRNLIINVARDIIYSSSDFDFESKIIEKTKTYYEKLNLTKYANK
jgi:orotidine-5'-phosphate decarboxylase